MPCQDYWWPGIKASAPGRALSRRAEHHHPRRPNWCGGHRGPGRGAGGRWWRLTAGVEAAAGPAGHGRASRRHATTHSTAGAAGVEAAAGPAGPGRASRRHAERSSRRGRRAGGTPPTGTHSGPAQHGRPRGGRRSVMATSNAGHQAGQRTTQSRPAPQGPGGSRVRPLGGHQRRVQRIWVPVAPRRWQASTTRAAMPASADLPHVRGSYCFFTPTSPSILRTPS